MEVRALEGPDTDPLRAHLRTSTGPRAYGSAGPRAHYGRTGPRAYRPTGPPGHDMDGARKERGARDLTI